MAKQCINYSKAMYRNAMHTVFFSCTACFFHKQFCLIFADAEKHKVRVTKCQWRKCTVLFHCALHIFSSASARKALPRLLLAIPNLPTDYTHEWGMPFPPLAFVFLILFWKILKVGDWYNTFLFVSIGVKELPSPLFHIKAIWNFKASWHLITGNPRLLLLQ